VRPKAIEVAEPTDPNAEKKNLGTTADNSTTIGNSRSRNALNSHMSDSDIIRGTMGDDLNNTNESEAHHRIFSGDSGEGVFDSQDDDIDQNKSGHLPKINGSQKRDPNQTMNDFEIKYGEQKDYMNEFKM